MAPSLLRPRVVPLAPALAMLLCGAASAQPLPTLSDRARDADRVAHVRVVDTAVQLPDGDVARMVTLTHLAVLADLKGNGPRTVELVQLGGTYGAWERHVAGDATFRKDEQALVFLRCRNPERPDRCTLVGLGQGKLPVAGAGKEAGVQLASGAAARPLAEVARELALPSNSSSSSNDKAGQQVRTVKR